MVITNSFENNITRLDRANWGLSVFSIHFLTMQKKTALQDWIKPSQA